MDAIQSASWDGDQEAQAPSGDTSDQEVPSSSNQASESAQAKRLDDLQTQISRLLKHSKNPELSPVKGAALPLEESPEEPPKLAQIQEPPLKKLKGEKSSEDSSSSALTAETAYHPTSTVLGDRPPASHTPAVLRKWIEALVLFSKKDDKKPKLSAYVELVTKAVDELSPQDKPDAFSLAVRWGLPLSLVSQMSKPTALKASAVAAWLAP